MRRGRGEGRGEERRAGQLVEEEERQESKKQERKLASGESAAVCRPVGMPAQPGTLSQEGGEGGGCPGVVGGAVPNRLTGRRGREGLGEEG